jgi:hypothetical protein
MRISGLGSSTWPTQVPDQSGCPPNPCTWWDNTRSVGGYASQECTDFMVCAAPNDPTTLALTKGLLTGVSTAIGEDVGDIATGAVSGVGEGLGKSLGVPGWAILLGVAVGGFFLIKNLR